MVGGREKRSGEWWGEGNKVDSKRERKRGLGYR